MNVRNDSTLFETFDCILQSYIMWTQLIHKNFFVYTVIGKLIHMHII